MIERIYNSLGVQVKLQVPASVEEFDTNAKRVGATLDYAIDNAVYRGSLADFREEFVNLVEVETGIPRETKTVGEGDKAKEVYSQSEAQYIAHVLATTGRTAESFQSIADEVASKLVFDAAERERKPAAPKRISKMWMEAATKIVEAGGAEKASKVLTSRLGREVGTDVISLAAAIKEDQDIKAKAMVAEYAS
jgi:hypothetical protein